MYTIFLSYHMLFEFPEKVTGNGAALFFLFQTLKYLFQHMLPGTLLCWEMMLLLILCPRRENSKWPKSRTLYSWEQLEGKVFQQKLLLFIPWHKNACNREREAGSQSWQARPRGLSWEFQLTALAPQFLVNVHKLDLVVLPFHCYLVFHLCIFWEDILLYPGMQQEWSLTASSRSTQPFPLDISASNLIMSLSIYLTTIGIHSLNFSYYILNKSFNQTKKTTVRDSSRIMHGMPNERQEEMDSKSPDLLYLIIITQGDVKDLG